MSDAFLMTRVPCDFIREVPLMIAVNDHFKSDIVADFLRAYCLEARSSAITLHQIAQALRDGKAPIVIAAAAEHHACMLDEKNLRFREAMNNIDFVLDYFN